MSDIRPLPLSMEDFIKTLPSEICSQPELYVIDGKTPLSAFRPLHIDQISKIIQFANQYNFAVSPQGSRTALTLGRKLERYDIALDTSGISKLVEYTPEDLTVTIEAGATLQDLQSVLAEFGQYLPADPNPSNVVTIGGLLATARSGAWRGNVPSTRDLILGMTVVMADGSIATSGGRVVKNVSGFDMHRLHTGALGSLGIISSASFKVLPIPERSVSLILYCSNINEADELAFILRNSNLPIRGLTILGSNTSLKLGFSRTPKVLVEFAGIEVSINRSIKDTEQIMSRFGEIDQLKDSQIWHQIRSFANEQKEQIVVRCGVQAKNVAEVIELAESNTAACAWGNLTSGSVWVVFEDINVVTLSKFRSQILSLEGFMQVEAAPMGIRDIFDPFGDIETDLVRALKHRFDPSGILNPGRWMVGV
tara:strand:- start:11166 stop:12434 length:1269 start_codon:yes stop_codon:yes gene_type:complete